MIIGIAFLIGFVCMIIYWIFGNDDNDKLHLN